MATIHLVRHGETDWNRELRWQGQLDPPLNDRGREQARALAAAVAGRAYAAVYASDLRRAAETAQIIAEQLDLRVELDARLREIDVGSWAGFTLAELEGRVPEAVAAWQENGQDGWEEGESHAQMAARVLQAIRAIAARHGGEDVLVVSHGGPIRALKALAAGVEYPRDRRAIRDTDNCELCAIVIKDGAVRGID